MTPRLKILTAGLVLSLIYSISDYVTRNSDKPKAEPVKREVNKKPSTARVSEGRIRRLKEKAAKIRKAKAFKSNPGIQEDLLPISEEVASLSGWDRNPFIEVTEKTVSPSREIEPEIEDEQSYTLLDELNIETVGMIGEKVFVIINGQRLKEGDRINNILIESIESQKITFRMGKTRIIKDVGT